MEVVTGTVRLMGRPDDRTSRLHPAVEAVQVCPETIATGRLTDLSSRRQGVGFRGIQNRPSIHR